VVTATVKTDYQSSGAYLTTAGLSQDSSKYAGTSTGMTGGSVTLNTSGIAINLPAYLTTAQAPGAYLTTAALSGQTSNFAGTGTSVLTIAGSDIAVTLNTTGLTIGYPAWLTTAQAPGAYLTTAALSGQTSNFAGTNTSILTTAGTDPVLTLNTTGLTLAYPKWITTYVNDLTSGRAGINTAVSTTAGTDITLGVNTSGVTIGYPKWITTYVNDLTSARAGINTAVSTTAGTDITLGVNTSGVTIGYPAWITTYVNDLTSARAGINTAISTTAGTDITLGVNTSGVTIGYPKWITTYVNDLTSARAGVNAAVSTTAGTDITLGVNTSGVTIGYPKWITTYDATSIRAGTATSVVTTGGTDLTMALNTGGLTVAYPKWLTTAAATNDSSNNLGLNTSVATTGGTDIAMTGNSSGLTIGYPKWITSGSVNLSAGTVSSSASQFKFVDSNGISFGLGTGTAAGLITATIASSLNVVNFSAGAASSNLNSVVFSNSNAFAFGLNASTITAGYPVQSYLNNVGIIQGTTSFSLQSNSLNVQPFEVPYPLSVSYIRLPVSFANLTSTTVGVTAGSSSFYYYQSINAVLYSQGAAANSRSLQYFASSQACFTEAVLFSISNAGTNESIAYQITYPKEGNNTDNSGTTMLTTAAGASIFLHTTGVMTVFTGIHWLDIPFATLLTPGNYWVAFNRSTSTTTSGGGIAITGNINRAHTFVAVSQINSNFVPLGFASAGAATASTQPNWLIGLGSHSVSAQGATTSSLALSSVSSVANFPLIPMQFIRQV
jgi:hypothetical protein